MRVIAITFFFSIISCFNLTLSASRDVGELKDQTPKFEENYWQYDYLRIVDNLLYGVPDSDSLVAECLGFIDNAISANRADIEKSINIYGKDYMVTSIGEKAFKDCQFLQKVTIPDCIRTFGKECFKGCVNLQSVEIPESTEIIDNYAFCSCKQLQKAILPASLKILNTGLFYNCTQLVDVVIPEGVTHIGMNAFNGCSALKELYIPESVTHIDLDAFSGCDNLENLIMP